MPGNDEGRPGKSGPNVENSRRLDDGSSLPPIPPLSTWHVDPLRLKGSEREAYWAGYQCGYGDGVRIEQRRGGYDAGRRDGWRERVEREYRAWEPMARSIKAAGGAFVLSYAELQRRRAQLPAGYVPRTVPSFEECVASWDTPARAVAS